jgi:hypothetical protein
VHVSLALFEVIVQKGANEPEMFTLIGWFSCCITCDKKEGKGRVWTVVSIHDWSDINYRKYKGQLLTYEWTYPRILVVTFPLYQAWRLTCFDKGAKASFAIMECTTRRSSRFCSAQGVATVSTTPLLRLPTPTVSILTLNPLMWKIWWAPNNASRWDLTRRLKG